MSREELTKAHRGALMGALILCVFYGSILFFVVASALRGIKCASAPLHLHWELYSGSSVYELTDWWTKTENTLGKKLRSPVFDILFLREFYHRNRRFWYPPLWVSCRTLSIDPLACLAFRQRYGHEHRDGIELWLGVGDVCHGTDVSGEGPHPAPANARIQT